jgi:glycosyltransferase involved in cell wall biosynthesis
MSRFSERELPDRPTSEPGGGSSGPMEGPAAGTILFISHDASRTGAPISLLTVMRSLRSNLSNRFRIVLRAGGPLEQQFRDLGDVHITDHAGFSDSLLRDVCLIYSNTITNGSFLKTLPYGQIPLITHVHELEYSMDRLGIDNFREVKAHTHHFIACSQCVAEALEKVHQIPSEKVSVIPESIVPSEIKSVWKSDNPGALRKALGIGTDELVVLGSGTVDLRKGADIFVQLAERCSRRLPNAVFLWIGAECSDFSGGFFQHDVAKLGLSGYLRFIGQTEDPYCFMALSDVLCLPSREDPLPLVMLEAGALGKPVLAFAGSGGAEEYCAQGGGFVVPYLDVRSMAHWIVSHSKKRAFLIKAGERARKLVLKDYNIAVTGPRVAEVIQRFSRPGCRAAAGLVQLFTPKGETYTEENSVVLQVKRHGWNRIRMEFQYSTCENNFPLRLDPLDRAGVIYIARIMVRLKNDRRILYSASASSDFDAIRVEGTAVRLPDNRVLHLLSLGPDPILYLPSLKSESGDLSCILEVLLRVDTSLDSLVQLSLPLIESFREREQLIQKVQQLESSVESLSRDVQRIEAARLARFGADHRLHRRRKLIWGTGAAGRYFAETSIRSGFSFSGFIDADPAKTGQELMGYPIMNPSDLASNVNRKPFIIIGSQFHMKIARRLVRMGFRRGTDFAPSPFI